MSQAIYKSAENERLRFTRRMTLRAGLAFLGGLSLWQFAPAHATKDAQLRDFAARLIRLLGLHELRAIERTLAISATVPLSENELAALLSQLMQTDITSDTKPLALSDDSLRARLRERIVSDYRSGLIVQLHGWWISHTESLCFALLNLK